MRSTDDLIAALVIDVRPVTPLPPWPARLTFWCLAAGLWVGLWLLLRPGAHASAELASSWGRQHATWLVAAGVGSAAAALRRAVPGDARSWDLLFAVPMAMWLLGARSAAWPGPAALDWFCVSVCVGGALLPGVMLAVLVARAAPLPSLATHMLTVVGGVSLGALAAGLTCGDTGGGHHVASHVAPAAITILAGVAVCSLCGGSYERMFRD